MGAVTGPGDQLACLGTDWYVRMVPGARIAPRVHIALPFPWRSEELRPR
jgi:hypothetical protein